MNTHQVRLTSLAHGGGCGCKLAPSVLQQLLADQPAAAPYRQLLVGTETSDDAAVWQVDDNTCIIATTDFFMPMVDDPYDFGRIAATNAISDVYAMGGKPIMALAILGMPVDKIPVEMVREILKGGAAVCATAGIPVAGGHSIDCPEPVYGLAVIGICRPEDVRRNSDAKPGDKLILTKDVHAITDVTGFGVLGHALELARGSKLTVRLKAADVPLLKHAAQLTQQGFVTGASHRNWASYGHDVVLPADRPEWQRHLLSDPQTSGGLLVSCAADRAAELVKSINAAGYTSARVIGEAVAGAPKIEVVA